MVLHIEIQAHGRIQIDERNEVLSLTANWNIDIVQYFFVKKAYSVSPSAKEIEILNKSGTVLFLRSSIKTNKWKTYWMVSIPK